MVYNFFPRLNMPECDLGMSFGAYLLFVFFRDWIIGHEERRKEAVGVGTWGTSDTGEEKTRRSSQNLGHLGTK